MLLTPEKLAAAMMGCTMARARTWAEPLSEACALFGITTEPRLAAFIAQVGHESGGLSAVIENLNYSADRLRAVCIASAAGTRWRALLPRVNELARHPEKLADAVYADRLGNGPEGSGDGWLYRGRGPLQTTGRTNYLRASEGIAEALHAVVPDFVREPWQLEKPRWGALASGLYWHDKELNDLADVGDVRAMTKRINGGFAGLSERQGRYARAMKVMTA